MIPFVFATDDHAGGESDIILLCVNTVWEY